MTTKLQREYENFILRECQRDTDGDGNCGRLEDCLCARIKQSREGDDVPEG